MAVIGNVRTCGPTRRELRTRRDDLVCSLYEADTSITHKTLSEAVGIGISQLIRILKKVKTNIKRSDLIRSIFSADTSTPKKLLAQALGCDVWEVNAALLANSQTAELREEQAITKEEFAQNHILKNNRGCSRCDSRHFAKGFCHLHYQQDWNKKLREANPVKARARDKKNYEYKKATNPDRIRRNNIRKGLKKYGLTPQTYDEMLASQGGVCAGCLTPPTGKRLHVDHCHKTMKVRGLLCDNCNMGIGQLKDDIGVMRRLIIYLEKNGAR